MTDSVVCNVGDLSGLCCSLLQMTSGLYSWGTIITLRQSTISAQWPTRIRTILLSPESITGSHRNGYRLCAQTAKPPYTFQIQKDNFIRSGSHEIYMLSLVGAPIYLGRLRAASRLSPWRGKTLPQRTVILLTIPGPTHSLTNHRELLSTSFGRRRSPHQALSRRD
ncbi:hypothetical protein HYPSUDRAFT_389775 [Hypholoma sublateritium FD-334 SS-4]|uniref:Uncharacterized protein n=1 Tax=Hypholoma sublateritium (strain FD-334 SS-4) TaxID=945553 RepID=A0A0D2NF96_HYPSF|nr:hypothetical protein HYPSUDRAFT_389775 [Hypholoma sublateritium FD-334 SS-4]